MRIAVPNMTTDIGKPEFLVILALVACAQNRMGKRFKGMLYNIFNSFLSQNYP